MTWEIECPQPWLCRVPWKVSDLTEQDMAATPSEKLGIWCWMCSRWCNDFEGGDNAIELGKYKGHHGWSSDCNSKAHAAALGKFQLTDGMAVSHCKCCTARVPGCQILEHCEDGKLLLCLCEHCDAPQNACFRRVCGSGAVAVNAVRRVDWTLPVSLCPPGSAAAPDF